MNICRDLQLPEIIAVFILPKGGFEPPLSCENRILSPARLPVPPLRLFNDLG